MHTFYLRAQSSLHSPPSGSLQPLSAPSPTSLSEGFRLSVSRAGFSLGLCMYTLRSLSTGEQLGETSPVTLLVRQRGLAPVLPFALLLTLRLALLLALRLVLQLQLQVGPGGEGLRVSSFGKGCMVSLGTGRYGRSSRVRGTTQSQPCQPPGTSCGELRRSRERAHATCGRDH